jgi:transposase
MECKMGSTQSRYSASFKAEAVARSREPGANRSKIARELGISEATLYFWVKGAQGTVGKEKQEKPETEREELIRLRRELNAMTEERDFLKKAAAFFAKEKL